MSERSNKSKLDFPKLPQHEATWRPIYMEPMMGSGERITVAILATDSNECAVLKTLSESRLQGMFDDQAGNMSSMIDLVVNAAQRWGQQKLSTPFDPPMSGVTMGEARNGLGDNINDVLRQAAFLTSCFYHIAD